MTTLSDTFLFIAQGILVTLELMAGGLMIGLMIGTGLAILRHQHIAKLLINRFISLMRGTPLILQLSFIYFAVPSLLGLRADVMVAGILTFGLNSSAYIAEIIRSGIEGIPRGQFEAAKVLQIPNFTCGKILFYRKF